MKTKKQVRRSTEYKIIQKQSRRRHQCLCCVLHSKDKQGRIIKGKEQVGRKYKEQEKDLKGIPLGTWVSVCCECCVLFWPLSLSIRAVGKNHPVMLLHSKKYVVFSPIKRILIMC